MTTLKATRTRCGVDAIAPVYTTVEAIGADFMKYFKSKFQIYIVSETDEELVFDMVGIDAPIANALRRILLAEVPSMAIEAVYIYANTSIIQDEILAHRMGLIPLNADPRLFEMLAPGDEATDLNTLVFTLKAVGKFNTPSGEGSDAAAAALEGDEDAEGASTKVFSSLLQWDPQGSQAERLPANTGSVHPDILVAKLTPGQTIELEAHAVKGIGADHAKFSPVSTAAYRLLPRVILSAEKPFLDEEADELVAKCPVGVFDIEDLGGGRKKGRVARPRDCTLCRECVRDPAWQDRVSLERVNDHFIFSVESTGAMPARAIVQEGIKILAEKARKVVATMDGGNSSSSTTTTTTSSSSGSSNAASSSDSGALIGAGGAGGVPLMPAHKAERTREAAMRNPEDENDI